ncbi:uncharacterized protein LOC111697433 [Eurytemora carolleeae]|uniref:uncharacterized protein LOC111697433 n=1 Tax=Eurytemora carolleeae TaxID=1294199 RepID=UPI000C762348|nr:uncharacterized protein LOC111697433 [Eurytemora carolleeae]|eukprot:XP_023323223.1 uncharacterized protein LOC111697433 [Eurytemora affinis]
MPISRSRVPPVNPLQLENIYTLIKLSEEIEEQRYESACQDIQVDVTDVIEENDLWLVKYDELSQKTRSIPLSHLGCCKEGGELFSALCMWVDVNQRYVDLGLFPQWYDIARELNIDEMKTEWVKVCIRPEQSFTRAILEIYMYDGGTLGEVVSALRKQKQYRIIQEISDKADVFLDVYTVYHKNNYNPTVTNDNHLYSIMRTLFDTFSKTGYEDPLSKFQDYSQGFKNYFRTDRSKIQPQTELIMNPVQFNGTSSFPSQDSGYTSPREYGGYLPAMPPMDITSNSVTNFR